MVACIDVFHVPGERSGAVASPRCRCPSVRARARSGSSSKRWIPRAARVCIDHSSSREHKRASAVSQRGGGRTKEFEHLPEFASLSRQVAHCRTSQASACHALRCRRSPLSLVGERRNQICLSMALASLANKVAVVSSQSAAALSRACLAECRNLARARSMAEM